MVFSSNVFLLIFLPVFFAIYYLTPNKLRSYTILIGSYTFYAWWRVDYLVLVALISVWSYIASLMIYSARDKSWRLIFMWLGIGGDLASLAYFKYFNFFFANLNDVLTTFGSQPFDVWNVILPIGISFHVFQSVSYVIDVYRGDVPPARRLVDFLAFTSLFPQLIAGPVLRYKDLADQFVDRVHSWELFSRGALILALGFSKKILIADTVAPIATMAFNQPDPTFVDAWFGAIAYTAQLYFDFSGYSDMAIGLGLMMGFKFMQNFDNPYISQSITEFWRRWHISLSTWLRDYLYIPLGGNRKGPVRTYVNLVLTMLLGGFWHGANWTFLLWGAWHGGWMAIERKLNSKSKTTVYPKLIAMPLTFLLVVIGWVMFRAPTVEVALSMYAGMLGLNGAALSPELSWQITSLELTTLVIAYAIVWGGPFIRPWLTNGILAGEARMSAVYALSIPLFVLALFKLSAQSYTPFLYFQF
jgi:alginate O-acetyltransferase complex protein AlgI